MTGRGTAADLAVPLVVRGPNGFAGRWPDSAKLVVVGLHQGFLLFLVVTGLFAGTVVTLGLIAAFTLGQLLRLHVPVEELMEVEGSLSCPIKQRCSPVRSRDILCTASGVLCLYF